MTPEQIAAIAEKIERDAASRRYFAKCKRPVRPILEKNNG